MKLLLLLLLIAATAAAPPIDFVEVKVVHMRNEEVRLDVIVEPAIFYPFITSVDGITLTPPTRSIIISGSDDDDDSNIEVDISIENAAGKIVGEYTKSVQVHTTQKKNDVDDIHPTAAAAAPDDFTMYYIPIAVTASIAIVSLILATILGSNRRVKRQQTTATAINPHMMAINAGLVPKEAAGFKHILAQ